MQALDLAGQSFGRLTVARFQETVGGRRRWFCVCSCGGHRVVATPELRRGEARSCGCIRAETAARQGRQNTQHGEAVTGAESLEYRSWVEMRRRCSNRKCIGFAHYGGRGISVCERWDIFANFLADMGRKPSPRHSIDRINNDGNYEPGNCRWATPQEQARNRRNPRRKRGAT